MITLIAALAIAWALVLSVCAILSELQQGDEWEDEEQW